MVQKKKKKLSRLRRTYRMVILNDQTFEERWSCRLTGLNVVSTISGIALLFTFVGILLISFTPLKQLLPEYPDAEFHEQMVQNALRLDSIETQLAVRDQYIRNLQHIIIGESRTKIDNVPDTVELYTELDLEPSKDDSALRKRVELNQQANILGSQIQNSASGIEKINFYPPVKGMVSNKFDYKKDHFGIDIVTEKLSTIHSVLNGTVISSSWSLQTGYTLQVQHANDLVSVYKHNESLLKEQGDLVTAGEAIAFVGNTGEFSTGPHLHFELWYKGRPINPENFIDFE